MAMENSPDREGRELKPPEFSEIICWCESTGRYTNAQGQEFEIRVRGASPEPVEEYMKNVRVDFEVVPMGEARREELEPTRKNDKQESDSTEEESDEPYTELDLEIEVEVINPQGIEPPFLFRSVIDPSLGKNASHRYRTTGSVTTESVTVTAIESGGVKCTLYNGSSWNNKSQVDDDRADTYLDPPGRDAYDDVASLYGSATPSTKFFAKVKGLKTVNPYEITWSAAMERF